MSPDTALGEDDEQDLEDEARPDRAAPGPHVWFAPTPLLQLLLFGVTGGSLYCMYWCYRNWVAYRRAWGYSREPFWREVHATTGYRVSPFWRTSMFSWYALCLFLAVQRESKKRQLAGLGSALLWAFLLSCLGFYRIAGATTFLGHALLSPVWALLPAQAAINRLNRNDGQPIRFRIAPVEVVLALIGGVFMCVGKR